MITCRPCHASSARALASLMASFTAGDRATITSPSLASVTSRKFIAGAPMKPATNRLTGWP
jgi:hypothetical protein